MIVGRMHELKRIKSVVNHFRNPIESLVMKEKRFPQIKLSLFDLKTVNKTGERSLQSYNRDFAFFVFELT